MFTQRAVIPALIVLLLGVSTSPDGICSSASKGDDKTKSAAEVRTIQFPKGEPVGRLFLVPPGEQTSDLPRVLKAVAIATGQVTVTVPAGQQLMLDASRRIIENPLLLNEFSPDGLDILKMSFIAMDEREEGLCDKALGYVSRLKSLKQLNLRGSDVSDSGLAKLTNMPHLTYIECFHDNVEGDSFKTLSALPQLALLFLAHCPVKQSNWAYLARFPKLQRVIATGTRLNEVGLTSLSKCSGLTDLAIGGNKDVTDDSIKVLANLKKLSNLDVSGTPVTLKGLRQLHNLKITDLKVGDSFRPAEGELRAMFPGPGLKIYYKSPKKVSSDDKVIFSPVSKDRFR